MTDRLDELETKLRNDETIAYDDAADLFELPMTGQQAIAFNKLDRAGILDLLRRRFPTSEKLTEAMRLMLHIFDAAVKRPH